MLSVREVSVLCPALSVLSNSSLPRTGVTSRPRKRRRGYIAARTFDTPCDAVVGTGLRLQLAGNTIRLVPPAPTQSCLDSCSPPLLLPRYPSVPPLRHPR